MAFSDREKQQMCDLKGVGATVVGRLEQLGFSQLSQLADESASDVTRAIAQLMGSSCWHNSPQESPGPRSYQCHHRVGPTTA
ncbi:TPA: helix-hairpin-helix domain-containing protein [Shewanella algae]|uniref:helix-hairpin-helix domain-containing protein n=1 Tax=Shewanella algae TaxID=38313 RepID=UPI001C590118|nr:helix-hairpin-helix domain-containing protein [Shewanella algae]HDS1202856.1 helix-hairpin-helix domain-containing protein [Shewanella algae]